MKNFFIFSIIILVLTGCGSSTSNDAPSLEGMWQTPVSQPVYYDGEPDGFVLDRFDFKSDGTFHQEAYYFNDSACQSDSYLTETWDGIYSTHETVVTTTGKTAVRIDLSYPCPVAAEVCTGSSFELVYYITGATLYFGVEENDGYLLRFDQPFTQIDQEVP